MRLKTPIESTSAIMKLVLFFAVTFVFAAAAPIITNINAARSLDSFWSNGLIPDEPLSIQK